MMDHLRLADGSYEAVPMGIFEVSEANRTAHVLELKAYDYMLRFDRDFNGFIIIITGYNSLIINLPTMLSFIIKKHISHIICFITSTNIYNT